MRLIGFKPTTVGGRYKVETHVHILTVKLNQKCFPKVLNLLSAQLEIKTMAAAIMPQCGETP